MMQLVAGGTRNFQLWAEAILKETDGYLFIHLTFEIALSVSFQPLPSPSSRPTLSLTAKLTHAFILFANAD
jgi:hypothetical protein